MYKLKMYLITYVMCCESINFECFQSMFFSALVRSVIKNFSMAFFFPASLTVFFFRYNRAAYDVLSQTVVVEVEPGQQ